jgi:hypothetical protein
MSIFCCWLIWFSSVALRGGLQRVDDGRFGLALAFLDRGDEEAAEALAPPAASIASTGAISPLAPRRLPMAASAAGRARRRRRRSKNRLVGRTVDAQRL